jgi:uncharacterized membrane protein (UPF0127 family)
MLKKNLMIFAALGCLFCAGPASRARFIKVYFPDGSAVTAELAVTDEERQQGLMFRDKIEESQGMLFVFEAEDIHAFWMKNMKFPIDILWLDNQKRIVHMEAGVPPCTADPCPSYVPKAPAMYVLELKSGAAGRHGLHLYDRVEFVLPKDLFAPGGAPAAQRD